MHVDNLADVENLINMAMDRTEAISNLMKISRMMRTATDRTGKKDSPEDMVNSMEMGMDSPEICVYKGLLVVFVRYWQYLLLSL